ncbi:MAG: S1 RNA-binding domain-containing protein [Candidatus Micrarchaeales archaeon]|nr:S1 RNA-binding domain-containing protein [Candidatus Micrarchaeales archaeon]
MVQEEKKVPLVGELVIAQISKIMPFGAYCRLPEYSNLEVFLPIKEVSSGWIKNIHEFIHEGQNVVCKVVFYDRERQTIDVSIKKVTPQDAKQKINTFNLEKRLDALFAQAVKASGLGQQKAELANAALVEFNTYTNLMRNAAEQTKEFDASKLPKKLKDALQKLIETSKKKKKYEVSYIMKISTFNTKSGATELRGIFSAMADKGVRVNYVSAPKYHLEAEGTDYADAEAKIQAAVDAAQAKLKKGTIEVAKEKLKKEREGIMSTL